MVHNNFIRGSDSKIYREKEMLFYSVDINQYYSSTDTKYFSFIYKNTKDLKDIETLILFSLLYANYSNFIFILPKILCKYCNIYNKEFCSFIDCWKIRNLNKCFNNKYRENV